MRDVKLIPYPARNKRYYYIAEAAARAESFRHYQIASGLWFRAISLAKKKCNSEWAERRHLFCEMAIRKEWS